MASKCQEYFKSISVTHDMSGFVAHNLSGLRWSPVEVTDETDGDTTGEPEDAI
jgi:hypothetical protein